MKLLLENWRKYLEEGKSVSKTDIHKLADDKGILWDDDRDFKSWSEELTGKSCLDKMTGDDLETVHKALEKRPSQLSKLKEDEESRARFAKGVEKIDPDLKDTNRKDRYDNILMTKRGRSLKKLFAQEANRAFMNSLTTVHWTEANDIWRIIKNHQSLRRDELSCNAFLKPSDITKIGPWGLRWGLVIKGHISLLANDMDDIATGTGRSYKGRDQAERTASSGANKGVLKIGYAGDYERFKIIVLDKEDFDPRMSGPASKNEALVDNWKIEAIIVAEKQSSKQSLIEKHLEAAGMDVPVGTVDEIRKAL
jgi:hypothetical protein